jgi:hypothetical protein
VEKNHSDTSAAEEECWYELGPKFEALSTNLLNFI